MSVIRGAVVPTAGTAVPATGAATRPLRKPRRVILTPRVPRRRRLPRGPPSGRPGRARPRRACSPASPPRSRRGSRTRDGGRRGPGNAPWRGRRRSPSRAPCPRPEKVFDGDHLQARAHEVEGGAPASVSPFHDRVPNVEVIAGPSWIEAVHHAGDVPDRAAQVARVVVESELDPAARGELGQPPKVGRRLLQLVAHVHEGVAVVAGLEEADPVAARGLEDGEGRGVRRGKEAGGDHGDVQALLAKRAEERREVRRGALRSNVAARADREVDAGEAEGLDRAPQGARGQGPRLRRRRPHGPPGRPRCSGARRVGPRAVPRHASQGGPGRPHDHHRPPFRVGPHGPPHPRGRGPQPGPLLQARLLPLRPRGRAQRAGEGGGRPSGAGRARRALRGPARIPQPRGLPGRPGLGHRPRDGRPRSTMGRLLLRRSARGRGRGRRRLARRPQPRGPAPEDGRHQRLFLGEGGEGLAAARLPAGRGHGALEGLLRRPRQGAFPGPRLPPSRVRDPRRDLGGEAGEHARRGRARPGLPEGGPRGSLRRRGTRGVRITRRGFLSGLVAAPVAGTAVPAVGTTAPRMTDIRVLDVRHGYEDWRYRAPYKFGGRVVDRVTILNVRCRVETRAGKGAWGFGSMTMGNMWAFPSPTMSYDVTLGAMKDLAERMARLTSRCREVGHPLDLSLVLEPEYLAAAAEVSRERRLDQPIPKLCTLVAASPFDAALHDAFGKAHARNVYATYGPDLMTHDLSRYLGPEFKGERLDRCLLGKPRERIPLFHSVGGLDPLEAKDVE